MSIYEKIKQRVYEIIGPAAKGDKLSYAVDIIICTLVLLSSAAVIVELIGVSVVLILLSVSFILLETFPIGQKIHQFLYIFEVGIASFFTVEYVLRVWTAPMEYPDLRPDKARMHYIFSFMSLVDILSIVPVFVANLPTATGVMKIFKLCKILRLIKASRYLRGVANFGHAIQAKKR